MDFTPEAADENAQQSIDALGVVFTDVIAATNAAGREYLGDVVEYCHSRRAMGLDTRAMPVVFYTQTDEALQTIATRHTSTLEASSSQAMRAAQYNMYSAERQQSQIKTRHLAKPYTDDPEAVAHETYHRLTLSSCETTNELSSSSASSFAHHGCASPTSPVSSRGQGRVISAVVSDASPSLTHPDHDIVPQDHCHHMSPSSGASSSARASGSPATPSGQVGGRARTRDNENAAVVTSSPYSVERSNHRAAIRRQSTVDPAAQDHMPLSMRNDERRMSATSVTDDSEPLVVTTMDTEAAPTDDYTFTAPEFSEHALLESMDGATRLAYIRARIHPPRTEMSAVATYVHALEQSASASHHVQGVESATGVPPMATHVPGGREGEAGPSHMGAPAGPGVPYQGDASAEHFSDDRYRAAAEADGQHVVRDPALQVHHGYYPYAQDPPPFGVEGVFGPHAIDANQYHPNDSSDEGADADEVEVADEEESEEEDDDDVEDDESVFSDVSMVTFESDIFA